MRKKHIALHILYIFCLVFIFSTPFKSFAQENFVVVLDAGHGGKDPGKNSGKYYEKNIALNIVLLTGKLLNKNKNIEVIYTRNKDVFIELKERGKIANEANANLFVSVHCNAHHTQAYGAETYVLGLHANERNFEVAKQENSVIFLEDNYKEKYAGFDPNSPEAVIGLTLMQEEYLDESLILASNIQQKFTNNLKRKDRGVKQAGFVVLHQTYMPSVLIETGFITNKNEGAFLNSKSGQEKVANAIYNAIIDYKKHLDENRVVEVIPKAPVVVETKDRIFKGINFKVQIASSSKKLPLKSYNFKGLKGVERLKVGRQYKYYYGVTSNYDEILDIQKRVKKVGFQTAFVIAYKNDKKISVSDLLKSSQK
ncbi:N-acetylmuramoyl-L-alanine amidase [hydrothermal vent metagenome]|uniref:N-acetylmuramoyl-L-alanine amidase n=1 Tax=hydrothermal vent metagenome TaxID=652676 RepID=A0A3B0R111_9ZZZZ